MRAVLGACALCYGILSMPEADASVLINIDLSSQTMHVRSDSGSYDWRVSTARSGYRTPRGTYRPYQLLRMHYSHKYHMSPMPYSIFFYGGYAIHGTYETGSLGRPRLARLHPARAGQCRAAFPHGASGGSGDHDLGNPAPARTIMPGYIGGGVVQARPTPCGAGNLTPLSPTRPRGMRRPRSGPGKSIPS